VDETIREWVAAAEQFEAAGKMEDALAWWRKAAQAVVEISTEPSKPSAEPARLKARAAERLSSGKEAKR